MTPPIPLLPNMGLDPVGRSAEPAAQLPDSLLAELEATLDQWGLYLLQFEHNAQRERAAAELELRFPGGVRVQADERAHPDWPALRAAIQAASAEAVFVQVFGLESWLSPSASHDQAEPRLRAWNRGRDGFAREVHVPVLLWLRPEQLPLLAGWAPDLWSWRTAVYSVSVPGNKASPSAAIAPLLDPRWETGIDTRTAAQRRARIDELQVYLHSAASEQASPVLRLHYLLECIDLFGSVGDLDQALQLARKDALPFAAAQGDASVAIVQSRIADILQARGELEEALRIRRNQILPVVTRLDEMKGKAVTQGKIADILQARGELEEALRIRRDEQMPVYERLGDMRSRAITQGKIADILQAQGELEEALRIRRKEELPVYERLGDVRSRAITQSKIADILQAQGELEGALRIRREEQMPVYERLGDVRSRAITQGQIADILQARGELEEALRIRREEELPVYERLGDVRELLVGRTNLAITLLQQGREEDGKEILQLLRQALTDAERLRLPEAQVIRGLIAQVAGPDEAAAAP